MKKLRAWWLAKRLPRCPGCGRLVETRGSYCSDACRVEDVDSTVW